MSKHRSYSPEFENEAVELTRMEGVTISQIARDLGIIEGRGTEFTDISR